MKSLRLIVISLLALAGLVGGGLAALGRLRWGDAGWYYHSDPNYRLRCGQEALRQGNRERVDQVALMLDADGYKDQAHVLRGEQLVRDGKEYAEAQRPERAAEPLRMAEVELLKIRDKGDLRLEAAALLGQAYFYLKRFAEAEHHFLFVLSSRPNHLDAHRGLAAVYLTTGAKTKALTHLEKVAELDPQDGRPYQTMGYIYKDLEQYSLAIECYRQALERVLPERTRGQDQEAIREDLADCLVRTAKYSEAMEILDQLDPLPGEVGPVEALRGQCLSALGQTAQACAVLDQALADYPSCVELLRVRARLHMEAKEWEKAVSLLERALLQDRHDYVSRLQLMLVYRTMGQTAKAAEQQRLAEQTRAGFQELNELSKQAMERPNDAEVRRRAAKLCEKLERSDLAAMWRQAAEACPTAPVGLQEPSKEGPRQLPVVGASAIGLGAVAAPGTGLVPAVAAILALRSGR